LITGAAATGAPEVGCDCSDDCVTTQELEIKERRMMPAAKVRDNERGFFE
jgi:hypothetical protein